MNITKTEENTFSFQCLKSSAMYPVGDQFHINYVIMAAFDAFLAPWAFFLNLLVLIVLVRHPSLRTVPNCILISLALSDMLTGLIIQPMKAIVTTNILRKQINCALYLTGLQLGYLMGMTSYLSLTLMSVERYAAIFHPFTYHEWTTRRTVVIKPLVAIWLFSGVIMGLSFLTPQMSVMRLFVIALIPTSIVWSAFVYIKATLLVKKLNQQVVSVSCIDVGKQRTSEANQPRLSECSPHTQKHKEEFDSGCVSSNKESYLKSEKVRNQTKIKQCSQKQRSNSKANRLVIIIMITLCSCYIPSGVLTFLRDYSTSDQLWIKGIHDWGTSFVLLNSTLNPIIYCLKITEMRIKIKKTLHDLWHQINRSKTT